MERLIVESTYRARPLIELLLHRGVLLGFGAWVGVDGGAEAEVGEEHVLSPLAPLESIEQVRRYSFALTNVFVSFLIIKKLVRREASSIGDLDQAITLIE